jgi:GWxTD domain-containing protein
MKTRFLLSSLSILIAPLFLNAQNNSPEVHVRNCVFNSPSQSSYVETYIAINPQTLSYKKQADSTYQATLTGTIIFKNDKKEITSFDKFQMQSPKYRTINEISYANDVLLNVRRNALAKGNYNTELEIDNDKLETKLSNDIIINDDRSKNQFSDIVLIDTMYESTMATNFTRGNYEIIPLVINYFPVSKSQLSFLTEFYPSNLTEPKGKVLFQISIAKKETSKILDEYSSSFAADLSAVVSIANSIDISKLTSGNYEFILLATNRNNEILATKKVDFMRNSFSRNIKNTMFNDTSLVSYTDVNNTFVNQFTKDEILRRLATLIPLASASEVNYINNLIKGNNENNIKMFYYNFWLKRNSENPIGAYTEYEMVLTEVNNAFGVSNQYGYETDRGRVYLQYGAPNTINKSSQSADMKPYEVWDYYIIGNQRNVKFVFYTRDRSTNDYQLAYTNKRGEVSDPNWITKIQGLPANPNLDDNTINSNFGGTLGRDMNMFLNK